MDINKVKRFSVSDYDSISGEPSVYKSNKGEFVLFSDYQELYNEFKRLEDFIKPTKSHPVTVAKPSERDPIELHGKPL